MKAIRKRPGEAPEIIEVENTLKALQAEVGGYIETVTIASDAVIICNEEGRILGLPDNCRVCGVDFVGRCLSSAPRATSSATCRRQSFWCTT